MNILGATACRGTACLITVFTRGSRGCRTSVLVPAAPHSPHSSLILLSAEFLHSHIFIPLSQMLLHSGVFYSFLIMLSPSCCQGSWWTQLWLALGASESQLELALSVGSSFWHHLTGAIPAILLSKPNNPNTPLVLSSPLYMRAYLKNIVNRHYPLLDKVNWWVLKLHFLQNTARNR